MCRDGLGRMDEYHMARSVLVMGRPWLGWMDDVKIVVGSRWMTMEVTRQCSKDRK